MLGINFSLLPWYFNGLAINLISPRKLERYGQDYKCEQTNRCKAEDLNIKLTALYIKAATYHRYGTCYPCSHY